MYKKLIILAMPFFLQASYAGMMGATTKNSYELGGQALYVQPSYGVDSIHGLALNSAGPNRAVNFDLPYNWGFKIWAAYYFNDGNDINLNWSRATWHAAGYTGVDFTTEQVPLSNDYVTTHPKWNAVNLEIGQEVNLFTRSTLRFHGGVAFANIGADWDASGIVASSTVSSDFYPSRSFNGFGPRVGVDLGFRLVNSLKVYSNAAVSMLAGTQKFSTFYSDPSLHGRFGSIHAIIPELEGKLGLNYQYNMTQGVLIVDGGWMWNTYFDAVLSDLSAAVSSIKNTNSNFNLQGLFFGLSWKGNLGS